MNIQDFLQSFERKDDVYISDSILVNDHFEVNYLRVREKENRVLSDQQVAELPILNNHFHSKEWQLRARSSCRLQQYFNDKHGNVLDLGCGNGWFTALLAKNVNLNPLGLDVNFIELAQAARVFNVTNAHFLYGDVFTLNIPVQGFDYIILNASIQYFEDFDRLMHRLFKLLKPHAEIHIIDSPFYDKDELRNAKDRTVQYYTHIGFPEMARFYFHHTYDHLAKWNYAVMYKPKPKNSFNRFFSKKDIPFPWVKIMKGNE